MVAADGMAVGVRGRPGRGRRAGSADACLRAGRGDARLRAGGARPLPGGGAAAARARRGGGQVTELDGATVSARQRHAALSVEITEHDHRYYVLDSPLVSDAEYDTLMREQRELEER